MRHHNVFIGIILTLWACVPHIAYAQSLSIPLERIGDHLDDADFWNDVVKTPGYVAEGAWLDLNHTSIITILYRSLPGEGVPVDELTNAIVGIFDKEGDQYRLRQQIDLWDAHRDYKKPERLSLPMHSGLLTYQPKGAYPLSYYRAHISLVDIDADDDNDILIELHNAGGSYVHYDLFLLQNSDNRYQQIFSKTGGYGSGSDEFDFGHVEDFDADGIPEILVWDEISSEGVPHSDCRSWVDLYHWNGEKMEQCNAKYPLFYTKLKSTFLEICDEYRKKLSIWHPDGVIPDYWGFMDATTGCLHEQIYYLGMIAEYEKNYVQACTYYQYFLNKDVLKKMNDPYVEAAHIRMSHIQQHCIP